MSFGMSRGREETYAESDAGRKFGWWLCINKARVARLDYHCFDVSSQFWHQYTVCPLDAQFLTLGYDPDAWAQASVTLESRYAEAEGYHTADFVMHPVEGCMVAIRNACVPAEFFMHTSVGTQT